MKSSTEKITNNNNIGYTIMEVDPFEANNRFNKTNNEFFELMLGAPKNMTKKLITNEKKIKRQSENKALESVKNIFNENKRLKDELKSIRLAKNKINKQLKEEIKK